ncbi:hypothetical protein L596_000923 [Steinernema carpocapsae]|uniref:Uncharacterized protein n=1 Tax=Steinernema carpocapsae TaxID=34508 RepID=A0A4U8UKT4_STECR|nr:hypothetical protein L596_000923 [Steinernema carpocapsae]
MPPLPLHVLEDGVLCVPGGSLFERRKKRGIVLSLHSGDPCNLSVGRTTRSEEMTKMDVVNHRLHYDRFDWFYC